MNKGRNNYFVYALIKNKHIVYIGCSTNVINRINDHKRDKEFDYYIILKSRMEKTHALSLEKALIQILLYLSDVDVYNKYSMFDVIKKLEKTEW